MAEVPPFTYTELLPLGADDTEYRLVTTDGVSTFDTPVGHLLEGRARGDPPAHGRSDARHRPLPALRAPPAAAQHPRRPRGLRQRPLRRPRPAEERSDRRRWRPADVPGHRHGDREGQEGPVRVHRRRRRGSHRPRHLRHLPDLEPALQPDGATRHVHREEHRHEPAGGDQDLGDRRRRLQVPVHGQGRRLGEQELPLPGDQGAAQRGHAAPLDLRQDAVARHVGMSAVPPRHRDRRHVGGVRGRDRQARVDALPRLAAHDRLTRGACLPRPRPRTAGAEAVAEHRHRRPVRRQVLLPRRAHHPAPAPRRIVPGRHRGVVLGRPPGTRQDHQGRRVPRTARDRIPLGSCPRSATNTSATPRRCTSISTDRWPTFSPSCRSTPSPPG